MQRADTASPPERALFVLECGLVLGLIVLCALAVRPLLEEWALLNAFRTFGLSYIRMFAESIPMRPLHLMPAALQWLLGQGHPGGVAAGTALMFALRYIVARWAVTPLLTGRERLIVASLAAVLIAWPGAWMGRFGAAQATGVLLFAILGFCIRQYAHWSWRSMTACVVSVFLLLSIYQALALCLLALPLLSLLWTPRDAATRDTFRASIRGAVRVALTLMIGAVVYGIYAFVVTRMLGNGGYEADLANSSARLLTVSGLWAHIVQAYATGFGNGSQLLPLLLLMVSCLLAPAFLATRPGRDRFVLGLVSVVLVFGLPLFSLIYVSEAHIRDIDRVLFPLTTGFVLVVVSLLAWVRKGQHAGVDTVLAAAIVMVVLVSALLSALEVRRFAAVQRTVIKQTVAAVQAHRAGSVLLVDTTGTLGDVYTLLNPTLGDALANRGLVLPATICTPLPVDRFHPVARRFPFEATPRCDKAPPMAAPTLVLTAGWENGRISIKP